MNQCETKTIVLKMSERSLGGFGMLSLLAVAFSLYSAEVDALGQNNELQVRGCFVICCHVFEAEC